ncbi:MAG: hypothetical protein V4493_11190 [Pseudomonadota bacterium]
MYNTTVTLCASKIIQDVNSSQLSAIDIYEEFNSPGLPFLVQNFSVLWTMERDGEDSPTPEARIRISQDSQELGNFPLSVDFQDLKRTRSILMLGSLVIVLPTPLNVEFILDNNVDKTLRFPVSVTPTAVEPQAAS